MKIKIKSSERHKIYANTIWHLDGDRLIQKIPAISPTMGLEPTFREGDNLRLDGKPYHVTRLQLGLIQNSGGKFFVYVYDLKEGEYKPKGWIEIGEAK